jgi:aspartate aminotransferase-like enzyme
MRTESTLTFKIANQDWEFEAIHHLNYKTFVEEIPQHARNSDERLVDKFHAENTYAIALDGEQLVGMVAGRVKRPFSLDQKVSDLDKYLPAERRLLEVRLLSVEKRYRNGFVFSKLVGLLAHHFREQGYDLAVISGTVRQARLYKHLGFVPFGPVVGSGDAQFQPMYLTLESFLQMAKALSPPSPAVEKILASYLPGPVDVHEEVRKAFEKGPVSHRSDLFMADFQLTRRLLCELTKARRVEILLGSGSLANDAVGAQLSLLNAPGLVLSNGEFGDRLIDHARRLRLTYEIYQIGWGEPLDYSEIERHLKASPGLRWIWATHCETSTGVLNDLPQLQTMADEHGLKLCLDCISSVGTVPVDLSRVHFGSCVSGKALGSFPGLSMVFYNHDLPAAPDLPRYLDLGYYAAQSGIPFTHSSNLLYALQTALRRTCWAEKFQQLADVASWLRTRLRALGFQIVAADPYASPAVVSIALPSGVNSADIGWQLYREGYLLSYKSEYLLRRNWIQICVMGEWSRENLETLPEVLSNICSGCRKSETHHQSVKV